VCPNIASPSLANASKNQKKEVREIFAGWCPAFAEMIFNCLEVAPIFYVRKVYDRIIFYVFVHGLLKRIVQICSPHLPASTERENPKPINATATAVKRLITEVTSGR
jgi:hypothetical protein